MTQEQVWAAWAELMRLWGSSAETVRLRDLVVHDFWAYLETQGREWWQAAPGDLDGWLERGCRAGKRNGGRPLEPATRATYQRVVLCCYRLAAQRGWLEGGNPLADVRAPRRPPRRPRALKVTAINRLLVELASDRRLQMMVLLGYHQLLRVGEICRLRVDDLTLDTDPPAIFVRGKGGRQVWMVLSPALVAPLRLWLAWLRVRVPDGPAVLPAGMPLIPSLHDPMAPLSEAYGARLLAAAMRPVVGDSGHALRHTGAQQLRRLTRDPFVVREALRHAGWSELDTYVGDADLLAAALGLLPPLEA